MKPLIYFPTDEEKKRANSLCDRFISMLEEEKADVGLAAYTLQILMATFKDTYQIDVQQGIMIEDKRE